MLPQINKTRIFFYIISFFILTTIVNYDLKKNLSAHFLIKNIDIETDKPDINSKILSKLKYLKNENIFFINKLKISNELMNLNFLEKISIKKNYPSTLSINAKTTNLIASTYINQKKYYLGNNGKLISSKKIKYAKKLPIIFGKFKASEFLRINTIIKNQGLDLKTIDKYYYHKNKRWDLYINNNILVMLPNKDIIDALKLYKNFINKNPIKSNAIIDLRISNRIILSYE